MVIEGTSDDNPSDLVMPSDNPSHLVPVGNSCRSGTGPIFIQNIVNSLLSVLFSGLK